MKALVDINLLRFYGTLLREARPGRALGKLIAQLETCQLEAPTKSLVYGGCYS